MPLTLATKTRRIRGRTMNILYKNVSLREVFVLFVTSWLMVSTPSAQSQLPPDVSRLLASIRTIDTGQLSVSEEDGRFMRVLVATSGAKHALEIGAAYGYSAIWIGLGLKA